MMKNKLDKVSLSWDLSFRLGELNQEEQQGLVRALLQSVSLKKAKEIKKVWFTNV